MTTFNSIVEQIKNVPVERWGELEIYLQSLERTEKNKKDPRGIMKFAGCFSDMSEEDFDDFVEKTHDVRKNLLTRSEKHENGDS